MKKFFSIVAAVLAIMIGTTAFAYYEDEITQGPYVDIVGSNFVADSFLGVNAYYNEGKRDPQCYELIVRFYETLYPSSEYSRGSYLTFSDSLKGTGYHFAVVDTPQIGDVIYTSPSQRRATSAWQHYSIVKDITSDGKLLLFEQNVYWDGKAGIGRTLNYPSEYYTIYAFVDADGNRPESPIERYKAMGGTYDGTVNTVTTKKVSTTSKTKSSTSKSTSSTKLSTSGSSSIKEAAQKEIQLTNYYKDFSGIYKEELIEMHNNKLIPSKFRKTDLKVALTKADLASITVTLYEKVSGTKAKASTTFKDTSDSYARKAVGLNILQETDAKTFAPEEKITREEFLLAMKNMLNALKVNTYVDLNTTKRFANDASLSEEAKSSVYFMNEKDMLQDLEYTTKISFSEVSGETILALSESANTFGNGVSTENASVASKSGTKIATNTITTLASNAATQSVSGDITSGDNFVKEIYDMIFNISGDVTVEQALVVANRCYNYYKEVGPESFKLSLAASTKKYTITLEENDTTRALLQKGDVNIEMEPAESNYQIGHLDFSLPTNPTEVTSVKAGEMLLSGDDTIIIAYKTYKTTGSYTKLGKISSTSNLKAMITKNDMAIELKKDK